MATNLDIITDAFRLTGIIGETKTPSAEQGVAGLKRLNQLMVQWENSSLAMPSWFPQTSTTDTCPLPDYAELAATTDLAIMLAPPYGAEISEALVKMNSDAKSALLRRKINQSNQPLDLGHFPLPEADSAAFNFVTG